MAKSSFVYILANRRNGALYTGVTSDLAGRVYQHKNGLIEGFTKKYKIHLLVCFEVADDITAAIARQKQIKWWKREWKLELIEKNYPEWRDLYYDLA